MEAALLAVACAGAGAAAGACAGRTVGLPSGGAVSRGAIGRLAGCYALTLGRWSRGPFGGGGFPAGLPLHIRLVGEPDSTSGTPIYPVRPNLARESSSSSPVFPSAWTADGRQAVSVIWSTGGGGYRLLASPAGRDTLSGIVSAFTTNAIGAQLPPRATVVAVREACAEGLLR